MTRTLPSARTAAAPSLVALVVGLACAATPSSALADVGIPLDTAISPQYHAVAVAATVESAQAAIPQRPVVEPVAPPAAVEPDPAPPAPAPEPEYHPENTPQYQPEEASNNSNNSVPVEAAPEVPAAPAEPAAEPDLARAREEPAEQPEQPAPVAEHAALAAPPVELPEAPVALAHGPVELPQVPVELPDDPVEPAAADPPAPGPEPPSPAPAPVVGNLNVSIRIFSPGDDGPVTQVVGSVPDSRASPTPAPTAAPAPATTPAPTTWIWNWTWIGAPGCDPGSTAPSTGVSGWTWNWTWSCDPSTPQIEALPGYIKTMTELEQLDLSGVSQLELPDIPKLNLPGSKPADPDADAPESRAGRERSGGTGHLIPRGGSAACAQAPSSPAPALIAASTAPKPVVERAARRGNGRDITAARRPVPAEPASPAPSVAVASSAAGAGAGAAPGMLATLLVLSLSFLVGALITGVGLPRLKPRAARLERPG